MMSDFGNRLSLGNRRVVKHVDAPQRENPEWDPITNNVAPQVRYGKKMVGGSMGGIFQPNVGVSSESMPTDTIRTGRKMLPQPGKDQPVGVALNQQQQQMQMQQMPMQMQMQMQVQQPSCLPTAPAPTDSPGAYSKTARMKFSKRHEGNSNIIVGEVDPCEPAPVPAALKVGRGFVQGAKMQCSGNILTGEGVPLEPIRRKQFVGGYSNGGNPNERPWAMNYEGTQ